MQQPSNQNQTNVMEEMAGASNRWVDKGFDRPPVPAAGASRMAFKRPFKGLGGRLRAAAEVARPATRSPHAEQLTGRGHIRMTQRGRASKRPR